MAEAPKNSQELPEEDEALKELLKKSAEFTQEKKVEEKTETAPKTEEKEEPQERTQKELPEIFNSAENKSLFEKLSDKTQEFAGGLYANVRMDIVDRAKVMFNEKLLDWHHGKATRLKFELGSEKQRIEQMEAQKIKHAELLDKFQKEAGYLLDAKTLTKATLEKEDLQKQIDKEKTRMERMQSSLEWRNQKKAIYERQRKDVCEDVIGRIGEKLQPFENKLENLRGQREQLNLETENFKKIKEGLVQKMGVLEGEARRATFQFERKVYGGRIKEIQKALKESEKLAKDRAKSENKIDKDIAKFDKKASPWRDKKTEFDRISKREIGATIAPQEKEKVGIETEEVIIKRRRKKIKEDGREEEAQPAEDIKKVAEEEIEKEDETLKPLFKEVDKMFGVEETEKEPVFKFKDLIAVWNGHFGSKIPLSAERMEKVLNAKYNSEKEVSADFFLKELKDYYVLAKSAGLIDQKKIKEKDFNKYLDIFEDVAKKKV